MDKPLSPPRFRIILPLLVAVLTFVAFSPALKNGFLAWDDLDNYVKNPHFRGFGLEHLRWMFTTYHMGPYQPLSWLTSALDYKIWALDPKGYHLTNLLIQSLNGVVFFYFVRRVLLFAWDRPDTQRNILGASFLAALFFSIHPLRVESVVWATERRDVLSGLFFLLAGWAYLKRWPTLTGGPEETRWYPWSLVLFLLGLLSKATTVGLLWVLIALDVFPLRRLATDPRRWFRRESWPIWREKIPFFVLGAAAVINGALGLTQAMSPYSLTERLSFFFYGTIFYLQKTIWPGELSPLYEVPYVFQSMAGSFAACAILSLVLTAIFLGLYRRSPAFLLAWGCYLLIFAPVSGLAQNGPQLVAARYSYLSCIPWPFLLAGFLLKRRSAWLPMAALLGVLGWQTWAQTHHWRDDLSLWGHALEMDPKNSRAHNNYGAALMKKGRLEEAAAHYEQSLELNPTLAEAYRDMGLVLMEQKKPQEALAYYKNAEALRASVPELAVNMAAAYYALGKIDEAITYYQKALDLHTPHEAEVFSNLALSYMLKGNTEMAIAYYEKARNLRPDLPQVRLNLATAYAKLGRREEAIKEAQAALDIKPDYAKAHYLLGKLLTESGRAEEGAEHLRQAERLGLPTKK